MVLGKSTLLSACTHSSDIFLHFVLNMSYGHGGWKCIYAVYGLEICVLAT